jgi:hypothetical protein
LANFAHFFPNYVKHMEKLTFHFKQKDKTRIISCNNS